MLNSLASGCIYALGWIRITIAVPVELDVVLEPQIGYQVPSGPISDSGKIVKPKSGIRDGRFA